MDDDEVGDANCVERLLWYEARVREGCCWEMMCAAAIFDDEDDDDDDEAPLELS